MATLAGQSKVHSAAEAVLNIVIGSGVALTAQLVIFPLYGIHVPLSTDLWITFWFTWISLARSYVLRRIFNKATIITQEEGTIAICPR